MPSTDSVVVNRRRREMKGRSVILSEEQLQELIDSDIARIKSWKYYNNFAKFEDEHPDYSFEFCLFTPERTGLTVDVVLDETANHVYDGHPLFMCFRNGGDDCDEYVPVAVHRFHPFIMDRNIQINIPQADVKAILKFVRKHYYTIVDYGHGHITRESIVKAFKRKRLSEGRLDEMPVINGEDIGLPFDIWVDTVKRNMKHGKRVKFKTNDSKFSRGWSSMTIDKVEPRIFNMDGQTSVKSKDIEKLKDFVRMNYEPLTLAADGKVKDVEELMDMFLTPRDVMTLVADDNKVYVDIVYTGGRLYFVGDGKEKTRQLLTKMHGVKPFHVYGQDSLYMDVNGTQEDSITFAEKVKDTLYTSAKSMGLKLVLTNDATLANKVEFCRNTN